MNNRLTGPTPLPPTVTEALGTPMLSHRSTDFRRTVRAVVERLRPLFGATTDPMLFPASGTGGMEAAVVNTLAPGERVLAVNTGMFGARFADIARRYGCDVVEWEVPWGQAADPDALADQLAAEDFAAVLLTHNETSTGVLNPLASLAAAVRAQTDALVLVDGVSSVGAVGVEMASAGVDVVVTATQKALMSPPGLTIAAASPRALDVAARRKMPRYTLDFTAAQAMVAEDTTIYTPPIPVVYALDTALDLIEGEGIEAVFARHRRLAERCRSGLRAAGVELFADPAHASPTVTSFLVREGDSARRVHDELKDHHQTLVSQGRGDYRDRMLRVGHMGYVDEKAVDRLVEAVANTWRS